MIRFIVGCLVIAGLAFSFPFSRQAYAQGGEPRLALVIGNSDYRAAPAATAANDAGLVADALRAVGFEVTGAANLDQDALRRAFRDFLAKAAQAGPDAVAFVYLAGRGLQYEGENYFAPIEAIIQRDADVPIQALRISDFMRALAALPLRARIVVLDAARANVFAQDGQPLAGGLALVDAEPGTLYAFNAAPGTVAPDEPGPYGAYAQALAEMLREGGISVDEAFARVRLRVDEVTRGAFVPWDVSKIDPPIVLLPRAPDAPPPVAAQSYAASRSRPIHEFPVEEAYAAAIERDTLAGYQDFLAAYPDGRPATRVRGLLAARREALTWRRTVTANTPNAYWTYMGRYPHGPHFWDARRRLAILSAPLEPPPRFDVYDFGGLPPPSQTEYEIIDRPIIIFAPDDYPPPPVYFLPPRPREFIDLPPPPPPPSQGFLPIPIPIPLPYARPNVPQGVVVQPNFGQQGPIGAGRPTGGQNLGQGGVPAETPLAPGQPTPQPRPTAPPQEQPAKSGTPNQTPILPPGGRAIEPNHGLPQGVKPGLAPATPPQPGAQTTPPPRTKTPAAPTPSAAPLQGEPNHALPQGKELPPAGQPKTTQPQQAQPGLAPTAPSTLRPGPKNAPPNAKAPAVPPSPAAPAPSPAQPKTEPDHGLPQGKGLPPVGEPKSRQMQEPAGTLGPGGMQGAKPGIAPPPPAKPAATPPGAKGAPPAAKAPALPAAPPQPSAAEPKPEPSHGLPQGHPSPAIGASPPQSPAGGEAPVGKSDAAPGLKPVAPTPKPQEPVAPKTSPQAKPKVPEPEAVHPNAVAPQPKGAPQTKAPSSPAPEVKAAPQHQQELREPASQTKAPPAPQTQGQPPQAPQAKAPQAKAPAPPPATKPAPPKPGEDLRRQEQ